MKTKPVDELLDELYLEADNKEELDYYSMLGMLVMESIEARNYEGMTQKDLAAMMKTMQSAISRFENLGREPSLGFLRKMANSLGHQLHVTLYGEFTATVDSSMHDSIKKLITNNKNDIKGYLKRLLNDAVTEKIREAEAANYSLQVEVLDQTAKRIIVRKKQSTQVDPIPMTQYCQEPSPIYGVQKYA